MTHGHINANSLRIADDFTFTLSDFPISTVTPSLPKQSESEQNEYKLQVRGFHKKTAPEELKRKLSNLIESYRSAAAPTEENKLDMQNDIKVRDLILEDWRDMVSTFYFPRMSKMITDQRIR